GSLSADLSSLPAGSDAAFTAEPGDSVGTLTWTPTYADAGGYSVRFTAANALSGSATTLISVGNLDRAPTAGAPATAPGVGPAPRPSARRRPHRSTCWTPSPSRFGPRTRPARRSPR